MFTSEIIARFRLQVDDATELSSDEELALLTEVYDEVCNDRPWEFLKKQFSGVTSTSVPYIALSSDFKMFSPNKDGKTVIFVGTKFDEYTVVPYSSRREYRDHGGYCYLDMVNRRLYFTLQPTSVESVEYDYIYIPPALTVTPPTSPLNTTNQFGNMIAYGMAAKFNPIEQSDKATSYRNENYNSYRSMLEDFAVEDANIKLAIS